MTYYSISLREPCRLVSAVLVSYKHGVKGIIRVAQKEIGICMYSSASRDDKKETLASRPPLLPPCRVCGGKASGFHYGVNTCEACKGFFRRSFSRPEYICAGNNDCSLQARRRNNCPACRLRKCQEVGMSKEAIKTGRYSYEKKTQYITEVNMVGVQLNSKHPLFKDEISLNSCKPALTFTGNNDTSAKSHSSYINNSRTDDNHVSLSSTKKTGRDLFDNSRFHQTLDQSVKASESDKENYDIIQGLLKSQDQLIEDLDAFLDEIHMKKRQKEFHRRIQSEEPRSIVKCSNAPKTDLETKRDEQMDKVAELMDSEFRNIISFIKAIPGWKSLDMEDQINLIKEGSAELWILGHCQCIDTELGVFTGEYDMSFQDAARIWTDIYVESVYKTSQKFNKLKLSKEELVVLKTIVLTFPDRCSLVKRDAVEQVQWRMIECFHYLCKKNNLSFNGRFAKITDALASARDMSEKYKEIVKTVVCQWEIFEKYPLLKEFFNSF